MPTYNVKNLKTGEKQLQRLFMTMKDAYCQWKEENPDWDKDWDWQRESSVAGTTYGNPNSLMDSKK